MAVATEEQQVVDKVQKKLYIGGEWRDATGGATLEVIDPATEEPIAEVADATPDDALAALAAAAGVRLRPSTLLVFGNPALGTLFITAKPEAGLDWPVRVLVTQDETGQVWAVYTDFKWIAARHGIRDRDAEFATATMVIGSITSSVTGQ